MEIEEMQRLKLATSYKSMSGTPAFRDLLQDMETSMLQLELKAASALPEERQYFEAFFTEWQQRKLVLAWVKKRVADQIELKTVLEEQHRNERTDSDDLAGNAGLNGY